MNDPKIGDYLLDLVPSTDDLRVAAAALTYFAWTEPDRHKFERVVQTLSPSLLQQEPETVEPDFLAYAPLAEWIEDARKAKNWESVGS